jgi:hypothetical protein
MSRHPTDGIKGSKPRIPGAGGNGKVSKAELSALNREYLSSRNRTQTAKAEAAEIALAEKKRILIPKKLAALQVSYLLSIFRQKVLAAPVAITRQLVTSGGIAPVHEHALGQALREHLCKLLVDLANLPAQLMDPNWVQKIDGDLLEQVNAAESREARTPKEAHAQAAKAKIRREQKTETMRKLRAERRE